MAVFRAWLDWPTGIDGLKKIWAAFLVKSLLWKLDDNKSFCTEKENQITHTFSSITNNLVYFEIIMAYL